MSEVRSKHKVCFGASFRLWNDFWAVKHYLGKPSFSESVLCHCVILDWTYFGPDIGVCIVHVVIFINKYLVNLYLISSNDFFKDPHGNFGNDQKICLVCFFFKVVNIFLVTKQSSMLKKRSVWCFQIFDFQIFLNHFWKKSKENLLF